MSKVRSVNISRRMANCPRCGRDSKRHSEGIRRLHEIGVIDQTVIIERRSKHFCTHCNKAFSAPSPIAPKAGRYTFRVRRVAVDLICREQMTLEAASWMMLVRYKVRVAPTTIHDWVVGETN